MMICKNTVLQPKINFMKIGDLTKSPIFVFDKYKNTFNYK